MVMTYGLFKIYSKSLLSIRICDVDADEDEDDTPDKTIRGLHTTIRVERWSKILI